MAESQPKTHWFASRTTGDLLLLIIAFTICGSLIAIGATLSVIAFKQPDRDLSQGFAVVADVINTLIGLLAGFLAGRTDANISMTRSADGSTTMNADRSANVRTDAPTDQ